MANPDYTPIYQAAGQEWNVDPALLQAVAGQEQGGVSSVSPAGAQGYMQIMPDTQKYLGITNPNDVTQSIYGGARYLSEMLDKYKKPELALAAYNAGPGRVDAYLAGKGSLPAETVAYVPGVTRRYQAIAQSVASLANDPLATKMAAMKAQNNAQESPVASAAAPAESDPFGQALAAETPIAVSAPVAPVSPSNAGDPFSQALAQPDAAIAPAAPSVPAMQGQATPKAQSGYQVMGFELPSVTNFAESAGHAAQSASRGLYGLLDKADQAVPSLGGINQAVGMDPKAAIANLDAQDAAYKASGTGDTITGMAGNLVGQGVMFAPTGGLIRSGLKAGAGAVLGGVNALAPGSGAAIAGNSLARLAGYGATGAAEGGAFGAMTPQDGQTPGQSAAMGALGGGVVGAALPALAGVARGVGGAIAKAFSEVSPETAALAQKAQQVGIDIHPAQLMPDGFIKTAGNQLDRLPGTGGAAATAQQRAQFTRAVAQTIDPSATTNTITRDFMQSQQKRIGSVLNTIESNHDIKFDPQFQNDLAHIENLAHSTLVPSEARLVSNQINNVISNVQSGDTITGETFGNLIHKGSPLDAAINARDSNLSNYVGDIKGALRDAMQRSLPQDEAAAYRAARLQYKNLMTVAPLVDGPNPGTISPAALAGRVKTNFGSDRVFSQSTPLDDLAQIGQRFLKEPANSGTADRQIVNRFVVNPVGAAKDAALGLGALGASAITNPLYTAAGVGGAAALAGGAGAASRGMANALRSQYLTEKLISGPLGQSAPTLVPGSTVPYAGVFGALGNRIINGK